MTTQTPIQLHIPPPLTPYAVPLSTFLHLNPTYTTIITSTLIFTPRRTHILLLRRSPTELAFPSKWETPGGSVEVTDPSLLHAAARETFEETGLRAQRFVRMVGKGVEWEEAGKRCLKLSFEVKVVEMEGEGVVEGVEVCLDPREHREFVWAEEREVREGKWEFTTVEQRDTVLEGFEAGRGESKCG